MNVRVEKTNVVTKKDIFIVAMLGVLLSASMFIMFPSAFADANAEIVVTFVIRVLKLISIVSGVIFILVGAFKFSIAHANDQGPDQNKAIAMMATGLVLVLLFTVIINKSAQASLIQIINSAGD